MDTAALPTVVPGQFFLVWDMSLYRAPWATPFATKPARKGRTTARFPRRQTRKETSLFADRDRKG